MNFSHRRSCRKTMPFLFGLMLVLLTGCASTKYTPYVPKTLTTEQRQAAFDEVWQTIDKSYVDASHNGTDWKLAGEQYRSRVLTAKDEKEFWRELNLMTGTLKDSHTQVLSPLEVNAKAMQRGYLGLDIVGIDRTLIVKSVAENSQAHLLGIRAGDQLISIDNEPAEVWWQRTSTEVRGSSTSHSNFLLVGRELNTRPVGSLLNLTLKRGDGKEYALTIRQDGLQPAGVRSHFLASGLAYLSFRNFNPSLTENIEASLSSLPSAKGLILDLRGNVGGAIKMTMSLLGRFIEPGVMGEVTTRDNKSLTTFLGLMDITPKLEVTAKPTLKRLTMPLAILIDEKSASAAELMTAILQDKGRARVFGTPSCGCLMIVMGNGQILPGGGKLIFSQVDVRVGKMPRIEGVGIQPDQVISPNVSMLLAGHDQTLEAAQAWLLQVGSGLNN